MNDLDQLLDGGREPDDKEREAMDAFAREIFGEPKPVKLGNTNKTGKCGMCGIKVKKLYPQKVGQVNFMICARCKSIMDM